MSVQTVEALQRYLRRLCDGAVPSDDAVLLKRFVGSNDRDAFELLIARHGPMVLGTARRLVDNAHDAEDVFQAVFLSLARLAKTIRHGCTLPAWLHQATCRIAAKTRKNRLSCPKVPPPEPCEIRDPAAGLAWREVRQALDEELQRLPERLRSPLLLCYLSGLTRDEAAKQLGWSLGTLKRRLEEGRERLRTRLERRGITAVGLALAVLDSRTLQAALSKLHVESIVNLVFFKGSLVPKTISVLVLSSAVSMKGLAMKSLLALLAAVAVGVGIYAETGQADPPKKAVENQETAKLPEKKKVDSLADPLPAGSTLRFGTSRFRLGIPIETMAVSRDGKMAIAANGSHWPRAARAFDLISGRVLYDIGRSDAWIEAAAISPDGRTIVTKENFSLLIRDAATGKELRKIELLRSNSFSMNGVLAFTPDGKALAVTSEGKAIHLIDIESGKTIRDFPHDEAVRGIAISHDGKLMAGGGYDKEKGNYFARLWEVETGKELRRFMHGPHGYGIRGLAFSPDAKTLATGADEGFLRLFDVDTGKERRAFPKDGDYLRSVAFTPDGKTVAAASASVRLYDATTGKERLRVDRKALGLQFTDAGKTLSGAVDGAIYRWDATTGRLLTPEAAGDSIVEQILVTSDGSRVITRGQNGDAHIWDGANGTHRQAFKAAWQRGMAMSPDGRYLVWPVEDENVKFRDPQDPGTIHTGNRLRLYDMTADRYIERFPSFKGDAHDLTFTDSGTRLITVDHRAGMVRLWNVETGKEEGSFQAVPEAEKKQFNGLARTLLSPDGKTLAVAYHPIEQGGRRASHSHIVRIWDVATGKEQHRLDGHSHYVLDMAFSPDGRLLVTAGESFDMINQVFVWETDTGKRVAALPDGLPLGASAIAFSPDGRLLATAQPEGAIRIWEVATWTAQNELKGHRDRPTVLTFTPGGQLLSGSLDTTVLAWDIRPPQMTAGTLDAAWDDLAKKEASEAFKAEGQFVATPSESVKFFAGKFKAVEAPDPKRFQQLIADLDSAKFSERESASKALNDLGDQAKAGLEEAINSTKSTEVLDRARKILEGLKTLSPEQLRQMRVVLVLELIDNDESQNLLKTWASGLKSALLTEEAAAALARLKRTTKH